MKNCTAHQKEYSIYPGEYIPMSNDRMLLEELHQPDSDSIAKPLVNMNELLDCFTIEMIIPGVTRDDIVIQVCDNILSIVVLEKNREIKGNVLQIHEFDPIYFKKNFLLPDNADTIFISSEYEAGILRLYIPKTEQPIKNTHSRIIVY